MSLLFEDIYNASIEISKEKQGFSKVRDSCLQARRQADITTIWVDTRMHRQKKQR